MTFKETSTNKMNRSDENEISLPHLAQTDWIGKLDFAWPPDLIRMTYQKWATTFFDLGGTSCQFVTFQFA